MDKFTFLKERALEALNKLNFRGDRVFNAIVKSLRDESPQVRINAIEVLMNSDDDRAIDLIKGMLDDQNKEVVQNAVIALYNLLGDDILDENGYIVAGEDGKTNIPGIYAAGDIRTKKLRQVITAAADGANCVCSAEKYLLTFGK